MRDKVWLRFSEKIISTIIRIYQRFSGYIGASPIISAIFKIYRLTDKNRQPKRNLSQNLILDSPIF
ncbi:hypothetical protein COL66_07775 [Bacillus wiedmannii]|uniref:Uncharacterized protein n=1 Tax=Bacillus wiedmannii TaxID=1890302 RepID=A0A2B5J7E6_9BACI|nr:hypothetical protein COL66_07775 [Bacillus wiedmannii]